MLKEIEDKIQQAIEDAYLYICNKDFNSFILYIIRADVDPTQEGYLPSIYVVDNPLDYYNDETRENFYLRYMKRNYIKDGFNYQGENGLDDLTIEMMIYSHLWDSDYFIKSLFRIASIVKEEGYLWDAKNPNENKWEKIQNEVIKPLKSAGLKLGEIIEFAYSSDIRNAFAHSNYNVYPGNRQIYLRTKRCSKTISFDDFQIKFIYSVILMHLMKNNLESCHLNFVKKEGYVTGPIKTPDGVTIRIYAKFREIEGEKVIRYHAYTNMED